MSPYEIPALESAANASRTCLKPPYNETTDSVYYRVHMGVPRHGNITFSLNRLVSRRCSGHQATLQSRRWAARARSLWRMYISAIRRPCFLPIISSPRSKTRVPAKGTVYTWSALNGVIARAFLKNSSRPREVTLAGSPGNIAEVLNIPRLSKHIQTYEIGVDRVLCYNADDVQAQQLVLEV